LSQGEPAETTSYTVGFHLLLCTAKQPKHKKEYREISNQFRLLQTGL